MKFGPHKISPMGLFDWLSGAQAAAAQAAEVAKEQVVKKVPEILIEAAESDVINIKEPATLVKIAESCEDVDTLCQLNDEIKDNTGYNIGLAWPELVKNALQRLNEATSGILNPTRASSIGGSLIALSLFILFFRKQRQQVKEKLSPQLYESIKDNKSALLLFKQMNKADLAILTKLDNQKIILFIKKLEETQQINSFLQMDSTQKQAYLDGFTQEQAVKQAAEVAVATQNKEAQQKARDARVQQLVAEKAQAAQQAKEQRAQKVAAQKKAAEQNQRVALVIKTVTQKEPAQSFTTQEEEGQRIAAENQARLLKAQQKLAQEAVQMRPKFDPEQTQQTQIAQPRRMPIEQMFKAFLSDPDNKPIAFQCRVNTSRKGEYQKLMLEKFDLLENGQIPKFEPTTEEGKTKLNQAMQTLGLG